MGETSAIVQSGDRDRGGLFRPGHNVGAVSRITPANAREMLQKKWDRAARVKAERLAREVAVYDPEAERIIRERGKYTADDAAAFAYAQQYAALIESDKPRGDDMYRLEQLRGAVPLAGELAAQAQAAQPGAVVVALPGDVARALVDLLERVTASQAQVVDGEVTDAG